MRSAAFDMAHLLDGNSLEQEDQRTKALVIKVEMQLHVLMDGLEFVGYALVQELFIKSICIRRLCYDARSKRSRFMTLFHAATKSCTNLSWESAHP